MYNICIAYIQLGWASETSAILGSDELAQNIQAAEEMIQTHQELKLEITNKEQQFESLQNLIRTTTAKNPEEVRERMQEMSQELAKLKEDWEKRNKELKQNSELQVHRQDGKYL